MNPKMEKNTPPDSQNEHHFRNIITNYSLKATLGIRKKGK